MLEGVVQVGLLVAGCEHDEHDLAAASLMAWQASMPDRLGIRTSISTTSGTVAATRTAAAPPSPPTHDFDVVLKAEEGSQAAEKQFIVVNDHDPMGSALVIGRWGPRVTSRCLHDSHLTTADRPHGRPRIGSWLPPAKSSGWGLIRS